MILWSKFSTNFQKKTFYIVLGPLWHWLDTSITGNLKNILSKGESKSLTVCWKSLRIVEFWAVLFWKSVVVRDRSKWSQRQFPAQPGPRSAAVQGELRRRCSAKSATPSFSVLWGGWGQTLYHFIRWEHLNIHNSFCCWNRTYSQT